MIRGRFQFTFRVTRIFVNMYVRCLIMKALTIVNRSERMSRMFLNLNIMSNLQDPCTNTINGCNTNVFFKRIGNIIFPFRRILTTRRCSATIKDPALTKTRVNGRRMRMAILTARSIEISRTFLRESNIKESSKISIVRQDMIRSVHASYVTCLLFFEDVAHRVDGRVDCFFLNFHDHYTNRGAYGRRTSTRCRSRILFRGIV